MTPAITCLSPEAKELMAEALSAMGEDGSQIYAVPDCSEGAVGFGTGAGGGRRSSGAPKTKRAPSKYNLFIGECMRARKPDGRAGATQAMKECAVEWKRNKK